MTSADVYDRHRGLRETSFRTGCRPLGVPRRHTPRVGKQKHALGRKTKQARVGIQKRLEEEAPVVTAHATRIEPRLAYILHSYGLYKYGLCSYGQCSYGPM